MCVGFFSPPLPPFVRSVWFVYFQVCLFHLISNSPNSIIRKNKKKLQTHFKEKPSVSTGNTKKMWYDEFCRRSSILYKRYFISHKFASAEKTFGRIKKKFFLYFYFFVLYMCAKFHQHRTKTSDTFKSTYWAIPLSLCRGDSIWAWSIGRGAQGGLPLCPLLYSPFQRVWHRNLAYITPFGLVTLSVL